MNQNNNSHNGHNRKLEENLERLCVSLWKVAIIAYQLVFHGFKKINLKSMDFKVYSFSLMVLTFALTYQHYYIYLLQRWLGEELFRGFAGKCMAAFTDLPWLLHYGIFSSGMSLLILMGLGVRTYSEEKRFQRQLDELDLKSGKKTSPKIIAVETFKETSNSLKLSSLCFSQSRGFLCSRSFFRWFGHLLKLLPCSSHFLSQSLPPPVKTKLTISSQGVGIDTYYKQKSHIASTFNAFVESIRMGRTPKFVEIVLTTHILPKKVDFTSMVHSLQKSYSMVVGQSLGGPITVDISTLPHMLIAGSTGGGKSVFFKQALLGLLQSSSYIQMYLLDLKGGVEMKEFGELSNVRIIKTESEAVLILTKVRDEMKRRFAILEKGGHKSIVSKRDQLDKLIIGIDEASELYTKVSGHSSKKELIVKARELTDELAKLGRAASIHLIFATQKINKDTMDPKVQENIGGRLCFRVNTMENSMRAIGNKMAFELPDIKGRAIWATGHQFVEVQAPFLSDDDLEEELNRIQQKYKNQKKINFKPMMEVNMEKNISQDEFSHHTKVKTKVSLLSEVSSPSKVSPPSEVSSP